MKNFLLKKRYFELGGWSGVNQLPTSQFSNINSQNNNLQQLQVNNSSNTLGSQIFNTTANVATDIAGNQNSTQTNDSAKDTMNNLKGISNKIASATGPYGQIADAAISGALTGASNYDKGKVDTQMNVMKETANQANNVAGSYSAGQTQLNLLSKSGTTYGQKDLKTHKGWKNILGSTAKGAMAGATVGGPWGAAIGGAIGLVGSSIGELIGKKKRKKLADKLQQQKLESDYAVDYFNSKQAEQLASANDNAAKVQADLNKQSVLNLVAFGGKLRRKNVLLSNNFIPF